MLYTFQLSSVSRGTKNMLVRILSLFGTCWLMVYPLDTLDVSESRFCFFILRMRLNSSDGIVRAQRSSYDLC